MAEAGMKVVEKDGVFFLSGVLNEYADFQAFLSKPAPLRFNLHGINRLNSIGVRNLLKFLSEWGAKRFEYHEASSEFVDQINMIPALLGLKGHGSIKSFFVPYECGQCDHEDETLGKIEEFAAVKDGAEPPVRKCPKCGGTMAVLTDSFFAFLQR